VTEHLTSSELEQYVLSTLPPVDLLRVDDHLASCDACRLLAVNALDTPRRLTATVSALRRELALSPEQEAALWKVSRFPERPSMTKWLARWGTFGALAATAAIVANIIWGTRTKPVSPPSPSMAAAPARATPSAAPVDLLTAEERRLVDDTLARGTISPPRALDALRMPSGTLMGTTKPIATLAALRPVAAVVDSDRPTFEWTAAAESGAEYRVSVYDEAFGPVAASGWLKATQWTMVRPLARGKTFTWQVTARAGGQETTAPAPPQPEARFKVTSVEQSAQLADLRRRAGNSHVALAVMLADAGVLDEAERELTLASAANPGSSAVKRLQDSIRAMRP